VLNTKSGVIWFQNKIVEESTVWQISDLIIWEPKPILKKRLVGGFNNLPDNGFYHFLIEDLPRFLDTTNLTTGLTTIYGSKSSYVQDTFKILNNTKTAYFDYPVLCEKLVISEKTLGGIFTQFDHEKLLNFSKDIKPKLTNKNIFISRKNRLKDIESRGLQYINEIELLFAKNSFEVVFLEDLSLIDQISIVKNAHIIAGFHGAGLANMVWSKNKYKVIEISESRVTSHFEHLAAICNHEYRFVKASELVNYSNKEFNTLT
jgi:capsular polysaccharide biosynthesis protein